MGRDTGRFPEATGVLSFLKVQMWVSLCRPGSSEVFPDARQKLLCIQMLPLVRRLICSQRCCIRPPGAPTFSVARILMRQEDRLVPSHVPECLLKGDIEHLAAGTLEYFNIVIQSSTNRFKNYLRSEDGRSRSY